MKSLFSVPKDTITSKNLYATEEDLKRFLKYVDIKDKNSCWEWGGTLDSNGYGVFSIKHILIKAHRFSYLSWHGNIDKSLQICHSCDNPRCVNPTHLWQGTQAENNKDRHSKNRTKTGHIYGSENKMSKLKEDDVLWIIENYNPKYWSTRKIAHKFSVSQTSIRNILSGKSWRWIK